MTVRIWASDVSAWEAEHGGATSSSSPSPLPSRRELARIRTQHRSNVFQAFFLDAGDEGSDLLTCAADGAVRSLAVPREQRDRLFPSSRSRSRRSGSRRGGQTPRGSDGDDFPAAAAAASASVVESRCLFKHAGRAHKMALLPGSPHEFATCGEDGVVATFDLRERGRGGGGGGGGGDERSSPLTAAVGPAALAAAARVPGRSCFPPSDRACSRAQPAPSGSGSRRSFASLLNSSNVDVSLYSVSFDPRRPWLLAVGGDASEAGLGDLPACVVIDRRMLSIPPSEAFSRRAGGGGGGGRGGGRRGSRDELDDAAADDFDIDEDEDEDEEDPAAGTIFARGSIMRQLLESTGRGGPVGTLDEARVRFVFGFFGFFFFFRGRGRGPTSGAALASSSSSSYGGGKQNETKSE